MDECLPPHPHQYPVGGDQVGGSAENDGISAQTNPEQSPGSLFVSQALSKQKSQILHGSNARAVAKHNLEILDVSDFTFASSHPASHPSVKSTQFKPPSFTQPLGAGNDAVPACQERSVTKSGTGSTGDRYA